MPGMNQRSEGMLDSGISLAYLSPRQVCELREAVDFKALVTCVLHPYPATEELRRGPQRPTQLSK